MRDDVLEKLIGPGWQLLPPVEQLRLASKIIEDVAYCVAGSVPVGRTTQLVLLSANVDQMAKEIERGFLVAAND